MIASLAIPCAAEEITENDWTGYNVSTANPFELYVKNNSSSPLLYIVRGSSIGDRAMTVSLYSNSTADNNGHTLYFPMSTNLDFFCISFDAPSNFSGSVGCGCSFGG